VSRAITNVRALCFALAVASSTAIAPAEEPVTLPATPAGKRLAEWLDVMNSGDADRIRAYGPAGNTSEIRENLLRYRENGVLELRRVTESKSSDDVKVLLYSKRTGYWFEVAPTSQSVDVRGVETPIEELSRERLTDQQIAERVDARLSKLIESDAFSGAILIAKDGKPFYQRAAGLADRTWNVPDRIDTKLNVASIGKMFTAVAVAQLVEKGKLRYEDTLSSVLPDYPNKTVAERVRISHLLSHTSGVPTINASADGVFTKRFRKVSEYLPAFENEPTAFEPGSKYLYSNCGYILLGAIIEKVSGENFSDYVREHVFKPVDMTDTGDFDLEDDVPNLACGYIDVIEKSGTGAGVVRRNNIFQLPIRGTPCGLGYSTVGDLLKFDAALRKDVLVSAATRKTMWTPHIDNPKTGSSYGYGFQIRQYNGTRVIGHSGGWVGVTNQFDMYPDLGYTVIILNNIDSNPHGLARKIREWITQGTH
jgi:CubicO group peptidase (beta-lactamase class C family)